MRAVSQTSVSHFLAQVVETTACACECGEPLSLADLVDEWEALSLPRGSVVLLLLHNSQMLIKQVFALLLAGLVPALVSPSTPLDRINILVQRFNAKALLKRKLFDNTIGDCAHLGQIDGYSLAVIQNDSPVKTQAGEMVLSTSGTSGFSSGCVFDMNALLSNAQKHAGAIGLTADDSVLVNLPLFYSYAFVAQALAAFVVGAKLVISSPPFNQARYVSDIEKHSVSVSSITPLLCKEMLAAKLDLPACLRVLTVGGDSLDPIYTQQFLKAFPDKAFYLTYGITEAGPRVATLAAHRESVEKFSSVGVLLPDSEARLDTRDYKQGEGELLIHSNTLTKYRLGSQKTVFVELDGKQWLKTGDIFSIDEDGYLFYQNRLSDFVIINGEKVNLSDIKKIVSAQFEALSVKIDLVKSKNDLTGYNLDIVLRDDFDKNVAQIKKTINRHLKVFERPAEMRVVRSAEIAHERYK